MSELNTNIINDFLQFLLKKKKEKNHTSYIAIKNALNIFSIPYTHKTIPAGTPLFRVRVHKKYQDNLQQAVFKEIKELGYRYDYNNITEFGRCNEPLQSVFYCSSERETSFHETVLPSTPDNPSTGVIFSTGRWILQEDITVAAFPSNKLTQNRNPIIEEINKGFEQLVHEFYGDGTLDYLKVSNLLSLEFARDFDGISSEYLISAAFANYIYDNPGIDIATDTKIAVDGIIYPSVKKTDLGMNFSIKSNVIDKMVLKLDQVVSTKMELKGKTFTQTNEIISSSIDYDSGKILW